MSGEPIDLTRDEDSSSSDSYSTSSSSDDEDSPPSSSSSAAAPAPTPPAPVDGDVRLMTEILSDGHHHTWAEISKRMGISISQCRRIADKHNVKKPDHRDRWDDASRERLFLLAQEKPRDWKEIGKTLNRDANACRLTYRRMMGHSNPEAPSSEESVESTASSKPPPTVVLERKETEGRRKRRLQDLKKNKKRRAEDKVYMTWTAGEWRKLYEMRFNSAYDWVDIAVSFQYSNGVVRTVESCQKTYERIVRRLDMMGIPEGTEPDEIDFRALRHGSRNWSIRELHALELAMVRNGARYKNKVYGMNSLWDEVAHLVQTRSAKSCCKHWEQIEKERIVKSSSSSSSTGTKWRYSDDIQIVEQYNKHKGVWKDVKITPNRNVEAIRSRFRRMKDEGIVEVDEDAKVAKLIDFTANIEPYS